MDGARRHAEERGVVRRRHRPRLRQSRRVEREAPLAEPGELTPHPGHALGLADEALHEVQRERRPALQPAEREPPAPQGVTSEHAAREVVAGEGAVEGDRAPVDAQGAARGQQRALLGRVEAARRHLGDGADRGGSGGGLQRGGQRDALRFEIHRVARGACRALDRDAPSSGVERRPAPLAPRVPDGGRGGRSEPRAAEEHRARPRVVRVREGVRRVPEAHHGRRDEDLLGRDGRVDPALVPQRACPRPQPERRPVHAREAAPVRTEPGPARARVHDGGRRRRELAHEGR